MPSRRNYDNLQSKMNYWFTADTHFGHANIIKYCSRPFKDSVEMNEAIIENWNKVVQSHDLVYHLGDFCFGKGVTGDSMFNSYRNRLKGLIVFIKGNHDHLAWRNRSKFYAAHDSYYETEVNGKEITLCHYAMRVWNKSHHGAWHLYGHSHGSLPDDPNSLSFDCGVDCFNYRPINFDEVAQVMAKKNWKPIDHHGEKQEGGGAGLSKEEYAKAERRTQYELLKKEFEL